MTLPMRGAWFLSAFAILASTHHARAEEPSPESYALATSLFREGRRLMDAGAIAQACEKFAESQRLSPGGGTLLNLAACLEKQGKTASAWVEFNAALAQARRDARDDRVRAASERIASLEPRLSTLRVDVPSPASGEIVTLDHVALRAPAWGVPAPVDPGEHVIEANAPNKIAITMRVTVGPEHDAQTALVPALADAPSLPAGSVAEAPSAKPSPALTLSPHADAADAPRGSHAMRDALTVVAGAIGIAGVAAGGVFGVTAMSKRHDSDRGCPNNQCTEAGVAFNDQAKTAADEATVAFSIGGAGALAAIVLLVTRPSATRTGAYRQSVPIVTASAGGAFFGWRGSF